MAYEPVVAKPRASQPGPSRTITVEPVRVPNQAPVPERREPEPIPERPPAPEREPAPAA
jgi:hypothetical protein